MSEELSGQSEQLASAIEFFKVEAAKEGNAAWRGDARPKAIPLPAQARGEESGPHPKSAPAPKSRAIAPAPTPGTKASDSDFETF